LLLYVEEHTFEQYSRPLLCVMRRLTAPASILNFFLQYAQWAVDCESRLQPVAHLPFAFG
jgi:hypothetical protein